MIKRKLNESQYGILESYGIGSINKSDVFLAGYESGEYILRQGYDVEHLLFLIQGSIKVFVTAPNGKSLYICSYKSGVVGDVEFLTGDSAAASSVQAITDVWCIAIPVLSRRDQLKSNIGFMNKMAEGIAVKLCQSSKNNAVNILNSLESRLCSYITISSTDGYFYERKTVLSEILGTSYRHLLRTLDKLCDDGVLAKEKKGYRILDSQALLTIGEDYYMI